jgi:hypothetical protein
VTQRLMACAVCGAHAGYFNQWHNRDDGYGICSDCVTWLTTKRGTSAEELRRLYGDAGINYKEPAKVKND